MEQRVIQIGNSAGIIIPSGIRKRMGLRKGSKVIVEQTPEGEGLVVMKAGRRRSLKRVASKEFQRWLKQVIKEDAEILDELAVR